MRNHLLHGHSPQKIQADLHALQSNGFRPTIALVFTSQNIDYLAVAGNLSYHGINVVGVTATRTLYGASIQQSTIIVVLMEMDPQHYHILFREHCAEQFVSCAGELTREIQEAFSQPAVLLFMADPDPNANRLLRMVRENLGPTVPIAYSMAGNNQASNERFVFTSHYTSDRAVAGMVLDASAFDLRVKPFVPPRCADSARAQHNPFQAEHPNKVHLILAGNAPAPGKEGDFKKQLQRLQELAPTDFCGFFNRQPAVDRASTDPPPQWITLRQR